MFGADIDADVMSALKDGQATYTGRNGEVPVPGVSVMIDRDVDLTGAGDAFQGCTVAITFNKAELCTAARGGLFTFGSERFTFEKALSDDGKWVTAACMVTK